MKLITILINALCLNAFAAPAPVSTDERTLNQQITVLLQERNPGARILISEIRPIQHQAVPQGRLMIRQESKPGSAWVEGAPDVSVLVSYSALVPVYVSKRRISPKEALRPEDFETREIDVCDAQNVQYRGILLPIHQDLTKLEARQSILQGGYALSTGVQKLPDLRRGDNVRIRINAGGLAVQASGISQDEVNIGENVRVTSQTTKKLLTGKLIEKGLVEVEL